MLWWDMPAYVWVTAASAVAFVALVAFGRHWWHSLWYSWRHAAHVMEETAAEYGPGTFYGSAILGEELTWRNSSPLTIELDGVPDWLPAPPVDPEPWRAQMTAELSPEALDFPGTHGSLPVVAGDSGRGSAGRPGIPARDDDPGLGVPPSSLTVAPGPVSLDGGPTVSGPEGAEGVNAPPVQPSKWLATQLAILYTWSDWQQEKARIFA